MKQHFRDLRKAIASTEHLMATLPSLDELYGTEKANEIRENLSKQFVGMPMNTYTDLNEETPIGKAIIAMLGDLYPDQRKDLLEGLSESDFIDQRVEIYFTELERARSLPNVGDSGAEELARHEALSGLFKLEAKETPIGKKIVSLLADLRSGRKKALLSEMTEFDFVEYRVGIYYAELERLKLLSDSSESVAEEIATKIALSGLLENE